MTDAERKRRAKIIATLPLIRRAIQEAASKLHRDSNVDRANFAQADDYIRQAAEAFQRDPSDAGSVEALCNEARPLLKLTQPTYTVAFGKESPQETIERALRMLDDIVGSE